MPRRASASTEPLGTRLTVADVEAIRQIAWDRHTTPSQIIREIVAEALREGRA